MSAVADAVVVLDPLLLFSMVQRLLLFMLLTLMLLLLVVVAAVTLVVWPTSTAHFRLSTRTVGDNCENACNCANGIPCEHFHNTYMEIKCSLVIHRKIVPQKCQNCLVAGLGKFCACERIRSPCPGR